MKKVLKKSEKFFKKMTDCLFCGFIADVIQSKIEKVINNSNVYSGNSHNLLVINN